MVSASIIISLLALIAFLYIDVWSNSNIYTFLLHLFGGDKYQGASREAYFFPILFGVVYPVILFFTVSVFISFGGTVSGTSGRSSGSSANSSIMEDISSGSDSGSSKQ